MRGHAIRLVGLGILPRRDDKAPRPEGGRHAARAGLPGPEHEVHQLERLGRETDQRLASRLSDGVRAECREEFRIAVDDEMAGSKVERGRGRRRSRVCRRTVASPRHSPLVPRPAHLLDLPASRGILDERGEAAFARRRLLGTGHPVRDRATVRRRSGLPIGPRGLVRAKVSQFLDR